MLVQLLLWEPRRRPSIEEIAAGAYFHPEALPLGGFLELFPGAGPNESRQSWKTLAGARHNWTIRATFLKPALLLWLRSDPALDVHSEEFAALNVRLGGGPVAKNERLEEKRKMLIAGSLGASCSRNMCGLSTKEPLPVRRVCTFQRASRQANEGTILRIAGLARAKLQRFERDELGENGRLYISTPIEEWFLSSGELHFTNGNESRRGLGVVAGA